MQGVAQDAWFLRLGKNFLPIIQGTVDADQDAENIGHALAVVTQAFLPVSVGQGFKLPEAGAGTVHAIPNQKCFCMTRTEKVIDVRVDLFHGIKSRRAEPQHIPLIGNLKVPEDGMVHNGRWDDQQVSRFEPEHFVVDNIIRISADKEKNFIELMVMRSDRRIAGILVMVDLKIRLGHVMFIGFDDFHRKIPPVKKFFWASSS